MIPFIFAQLLNQDIIAVNQIQDIQIVDLNPINFIDLNEQTFKQQFRFSKADIELLVVKFELPALITLPNRVKIDCRIVLCILLRKLVYPCRLIDLAVQFGLHKTVISRCLSYLVNHLESNFSHLLQLKKCHCTQFGEAWSTSVNQKGSALVSCLGHYSIIDSGLTSSRLETSRLFNQVKVSKGTP